MHHWLVLVRSGDGRQFFAKTLKISRSHAVLHGDHVLPTGMLCDLQIIIPSLDEKLPAGMVSLQAEVGTVVFASGDIRLDFKVKSLSNEAGCFIDSQNPAEPGQAL